jgi:hypothetical protein
VLLGPCCDRVDIGCGDALGGPVAVDDGRSLAPTSSPLRLLAERDSRRAGVLAHRGFLEGPEVAVYRCACFASFS